MHFGQEIRLLADSWNDQKSMYGCVKWSRSFIDSLLAVWAAALVDYLPIRYVVTAYRVPIMTCDHSSMYSALPELPSRFSRYSLCCNRRSSSDHDLRPFVNLLRVFRAVQSDCLAIRYVVPVETHIKVSTQAYAHSLGMTARPMWYVLGDGAQ